jgi:hypothetical protein
MDECALGVEIAEDRSHTSIVAAGLVEGDVLLVELVAYLDGPDGAGAVLDLRAERKVVAWRSTRTRRVRRSFGRSRTPGWS